MHSIKYAYVTVSNDLFIPNNSAARRMTTIVNSASNSEKLLSIFYASKGLRK